MLSACASLQAPALVPGESEPAVIAKLGKPTHVYPDLDESGKPLPSHFLEYMSGPFGQTTYMAHMDSQNRLLSYEQVLTSAQFSKVEIGKSRREDILRLIGTPSETSYLALPKLEVWSYPYKENPVSDSMMHVHFDQNGVVQKMLNGPDLRRDPDRRGLFGLH